MGRLQNADTEARIDNSIQNRLGRKLRAAYREFTAEPVPMEQIELLLALRRVERARRSEGNGSSN